MLSETQKPRHDVEVNPRSNVIYIRVVVHPTDEEVATTKGHSVIPGRYLVYILKPVSL